MKSPAFLRILILALFCSSVVCAQHDPEGDSLKRVIQTTKEDTIRIQTLNKLAMHLLFVNADTGVILTRQALQLATKTSIPKEIGNSNSALGVCYMQQGVYDSALACLFRAKAIREKLPEQKGLSGCIANIGLVYWRQGNYPKALEFYLTALDLDEKKGDQEGMAVDYTNIGNVYEDQNELDKALEYYSKALKLDSALNRQRGIAAILGNMGIIWYNKGDEARSLSYLHDAYKLDSALGNDNAVARHLGNSADIYKDRADRATDPVSRDSNYTAAIYCLTRSLELDRLTGDQQQQVMWLTKLGAISTKRKDYVSAEKFLTEARNISKELDELKASLQAEEASAELYAATGQWQQAYEHFRIAADLRNQLFNDEKSQELGRVEAGAESDKQKALDDAAHQSQIDKAAAVADAEQRKQTIVIILVTILALAAAAIALVVFRSLRTTRKQKSVIEEQKTIVEEKNRAIVDSINYARRLQEAILPPDKFWSAHLPDSFILYQPKDIVAGDFYWMESTGDLLFFAVADCTGHGVPGALVSVVCSTALNRAVNEFKLKDPGLILDKVRELVLSTFEKSESAVNDGMDIALCMLNRKENVLQFSGANNPAWIIASGSTTVTELPANKQPVGKSEHYHPFATHSVPVNKGDVLYLYTDGYADQFGGPKGKKFKYRPFQEKLVQVSKLSMQQQKAELDQTLSTWRGNLEQVDDICIVGIRI